MTDKPKKMGRPPKDEHEKKHLFLMVRVTAAEKEALKKRAEQAGVPLSQWIRRWLGLNPR